MSYYIPENKTRIAAVAGNFDKGIGVLFMDNKPNQAILSYGHARLLCICSYL